MQLINTIEISPFSYSNKDYELPNGSAKEFPNEWNNLWLKCVSDKNIADLNTIQNGSFLVDIEHINDTNLEIIIKKTLEHTDNSINLEEQISYLIGGIAIKSNNCFIIMPTCCGDIGNLTEWESIFENASNSWKQLWIGHPWIFYKRQNELIEFSDYTDLNLEELKEIKTVFSISEFILKSQLSILRKQLYNFDSKIRMILEKLKIQNAGMISSLLTGVNSI